jgi:hypothetical protein
VLAGAGFKSPAVSDRIRTPMGTYEILTASRTSA